MSASLTAGIDSLLLKVNTPQDNGVPRDDLIGLKVWYSETSNFSPPNQGTLAYDGTGLQASIFGLTAGKTYYVKYALISEIEPDYYEISEALTATPVFTTQTVDATPPPTPTGVVVSGAITSYFISHDSPTYTQGRGHRRTHVFAQAVDANTVLADLVFTSPKTKYVGQFTGTVYSISSDPATTWHIWLKWETNDGVLSDTASGGITGHEVTTGQDVNKLLSALNGKIKSEQLFEDLATDIGTIDGLNAQWTIKTNAAGLISGFGLANSSRQDESPTSSFGIRADRFWIAPPAVSANQAPTTGLFHGKVWIDTSVNPNVAKYYDTGTAPASWTTNQVENVPFTILSTPIAAADSPTGQEIPAGVYINAAFIRDATIDNAKITSLNASKINAGFLNAARIEAGSITASKIDTTGLSIKNSAGDVILDAGTSSLGTSLYVGAAGNKRLLTTLNAFASTPNISYIGEFASNPSPAATVNISTANRTNNILTVTTTAAHGFLLGASVTIAGSFAGFNTTFEIAEITSATQFKVISAGNNVFATGQGTATSNLYYINSVYKNTTDGNSYILNSSNNWVLYLQKGQKGDDSTVAGPRGSKWVYLSPYTTWDGTTETAVNTYFTNNFGGKVVSDTVTVYGSNFSQTRTWSGTEWVEVTVAIDGNLLVTGSITADKIAANSVLIGHQIKNASGTFIMDFGANPYISISV